MIYLATLTMACDRQIDDNVCFIGQTNALYDSHIINIIINIIINRLNFD